jgi:hypothetical protein
MSLKSRRWPRRLLVSLVALALLYAAITTLPFIFPYPLFSHKMPYQNLAAYSDAAFEPDFVSTLQNVQRRLEGGEICDATATHRIFICRSEKLYGFFAFLAGLNANSQDFNVDLFGRIFISAPFIEQLRGRSGDRYRHALIEGNLAHIIAHEIMHSCLAEKLGYRRAHALPAWKQEGYAEYGATIKAIKADTTYDFHARAAKIFDTSFLANMPLRRSYYEAQVLVEYSLEIKRMDFSELIDARVTKAEALKNL